MLIGAANLCCASPSPTVPDSLVIEAYQLYGRGDCATLRNRLERIDFSAVAIERQTPFDLLLAFCAEREGEILSAKDRYAALIAKAPRSGPAFEAALRLRELERLEKQGTTREELRKRADEARQSPLYEHGAKPLARELPDYPLGASAAGIEGEVLVDFAISRDGTVSDLVILASDPPFLFDGTALAAVRSWVYEPSDRDQPRRVSVRFPFATARPAENPMLVLTRVDESELDPIERRGRDIYEYSVAAGRAKAALVRSGHLSAFPNYIVVPDEDRSSVRFLDDQERVFADVVDIMSIDPEAERGPGRLAVPARTTEIAPTRASTPLWERTHFPVGLTHTDVFGFVSLSAK